MMKAVNMKGYKFHNGNAVCFFDNGYGMLDTETNEFVACNKGTPYVLSTKKLVESCIVAGYHNAFKNRVKAIAK